MTYGLVVLRVVAMIFSLAVSVYLTRSFGLGAFGELALLQASSILVAGLCIFGGDGFLYSRATSIEFFTDPAPLRVTFILLVLVTGACFALGFYVIPFFSALIVYQKFSVFSLKLRGRLFLASALEFFLIPALLFVSAILNETLLPETPLKLVILYSCAFLSIPVALMSIKLLMTPKADVSILTHIVISFPYAINSMTTILFAQVGVLIFGLSSTTEETGVFSWIIRIMSIYAVVISVSNAIFTRPLALAPNAKKRDVYFESVKTAGKLSLLALISVPIGAIILPYLSTELSAHVWLLVLAAISQLITNSFGSLGLFYITTEKIHHLTKFTLISIAMFIVSWALLMIAGSLTLSSYTVIYVLLSITLNALLFSHMIGWRFSSNGA